MESLPSKNHLEPFKAMTGGFSMVRAGGARVKPDHPHSDQRILDKRQGRKGYHFPLRMRFPDDGEAADADVHLRASRQWHLAEKDAAMRIENVQKTEGQASERGFINLATFTLVVTDQIKLYGVKLIKAPDGNTLIYPPDTASGAKAWFIAPELREDIISMAEEAMDGAMLRRFAKLVSL